MISHRKRPKGLKAWVRRNILWFALLGIILTSMMIGAIGHKVLTVTKDNVASQSTTVAALVAIDTQPATTYFDVPLSKELQDYIRNLCDEYGVPIELVIAMIDVESTFRADVVSKTNDYGLMQINKCNHEWLTDKLGVTDFLDPYQNINSGVHILSGHLEVTNGDIELALMRYNNGVTGAKKLWDKGIYSTAYTQKIMTAYDSYIEESRPAGSTAQGNREKQPPKEGLRMYGHQYFEP